MTFTKEQLIEQAKWVRANLAPLIKSSDADHAETMSKNDRLMEIALAALTAEPYGYVHKAVYEDSGCSGLSNDHKAHHDSQTHIAVYTAPPAPVVPDGYALVPMKLTAENGAKGALLGEFSETKFINCPECFGDGECENCDGSRRIGIKVPVNWTTIKEIWAKGVEHFAAAPQQEADNG